MSAGELMMYMFLGLGNCVLFAGYIWFVGWDIWNLIYAYQLSIYQVKCREYYGQQRNENNDETVDEAMNPKKGEKDDYEDDGRDVSSICGDFSGGPEGDGVEQADDNEKEGGGKEEKEEEKRCEEKSEDKLASEVRRAFIELLFYPTFYLLIISCHVLFFVLMHERG